MYCSAVIHAIPLGAIGGPIVSVIFRNRCRQRALTLLSGTTTLLLRRRYCTHSLSDLGGSRARECGGGSAVLPLTPPSRLTSIRQVLTRGPCRVRGERE